MTTAQRLASLEARVSAVEAKISPAPTPTPAQPDDARTVRVAASGDDSADGVKSPVRTWARAVALAAAGATIAFRRGDRIMVDRPMILRNGSKLCAYGDGPLPLLAVDRLATPGLMMIRTEGESITIDDLAFDTLNAPTYGRDGIAHAIRAAGKNITVRRCEARNIGYLVNGEGAPDGFIGEDCLSLDPGGLREYLFYVTGKNWIIRGCKAVNSTVEHIIRANPFDGLLVEDCDFQNLDRRAEGDAKDEAKSTINLQVGRNATVRNSRFKGGAVSFGPLGGGDGKNNPNWKNERVENAGIFDCDITDAPIQVQPGTSGVMIRTNIIRRDNDPCIVIFGADKNYGGRTVDDVSISDNAGLNDGSRGAFAWTYEGAKRIRFTRNLYNAPNQSTGGYATGSLNLGDLAGVEKSIENVWSAPKKAGNKTQGGVVLVNGTYLSPAEWAKTAPTDRVEKLAAGATSFGGAGVTR